MNLGAFELQTPIGHGGMGSVWLGTHWRRDTEVAIKVMRPDVADDPEYMEAFETEVRSVASLHHPHIVTILDFGEVPADVADSAGDAIDPGCPYLVMEYARGGSVEDYYQELRWPELRELLLVTLDALAHAHARDVIHRDLKPENILVGCGPSWSVKLTDFGLAHSVDRFADSGKVETAWGTPQYMAPEQLRGLWREYGPWTDLYALGCMAFELICGKWPFDGKTVVEIGHAHISDPIPRLEPRFDVPTGTEAWVRRLLAKERNQRFCHAADAALALAKLPSLDERRGLETLFEPSDEESETASTHREAATQVLSSIVSAGVADESTEETDDSSSAGVDESTEGVPAPIAVETPPLPLNWKPRKRPVISDELLGISLDLFGLREIPLVGRESERDWLWRLLHDVHERGRARQFVIEGGAGTGKSELVEWLSYRAREVGGGRVLTAFHGPVAGRADGLMGMVERFLRCVHLDKDARRDHLAKLLVDEGIAGKIKLHTLLALFDRHSDDDGAGPEPDNRRREVPTGRDARYAIIYRLLSALADERPVFVWLDDIPYGWDALGFAEFVEERQSTDPAPILIGMTARTEALDSRPTERRLVERLVDAPAVERRTITPLDRDALEKLVRRLLRLDDELADHVLERSEGVPLFAVQLVEDWIARGKLQMTDDGFSLQPDADVSLPDDLHQLWESRVEGFVESHSQSIAEALELAAVLGQEVDRTEWSVAGSAAGLEIDDRLVDELVDADLVRRLEHGWRFTHGMLQESLVRRAREAGRWGRWCACCAAALEQLYSCSEPGVCERLASYYLGAGEFETALEWLAKAIDQAIARSDYDHGLDLIDWRDELTGDNAVDARLANGIDRARIAARRGEYRRCVFEAESAMKAADAAGEPEFAARAAVWAGVGRRGHGELSDARQFLEAARRHFSDGDRRELARTRLELGRVDEDDGDYERARQHFEKARSYFSELDDRYGEARCFNATGDALRQSGELDGAHQACHEALKRYRSLGTITGIADCLGDLADISRLRGDLDDAVEFADEALRLYRAVGSERRHTVRLNRGLILALGGDSDEAHDELQRVLEIFRRSGRAGLAAEATAGLMLTDAIRGRWDDVARSLSDVSEVLDGIEVKRSRTVETLNAVARLADAASQNEVGRACRRLVQHQSRGMRPITSVQESD